ncbi:helicase RepA family protein, partial [Aeromonas caviae]|uniref:helicase RepA family protein n=1 Tax=Aeromonas caviae TaxID=648 RepID=UPI001CC61AFC
TVGALVSPGATGKTMLALQAAVTVSGGPDMLDFASMVLPVAPGLTSAPTVPDLKPGKTKSSGSGACSTA